MPDGVLKRAGRADFADYLIAADCAEGGAGPVLTFDRKLLAEDDYEAP